MAHKLLDHSLTTACVDAGEQRQQQRRTTLPLHAPNLQTHPLYLLVQIPNGATQYVFYFVCLLVFHVNELAARLFFVCSSERHCN
jgi:hypothetical protein